MNHPGFNAIPLRPETVGMCLEFAALTDDQPQVALLKSSI
jgi:hypothetical protein